MRQRPYGPVSLVLAGVALWMCVSDQRSHMRFTQLALGDGNIFSDGLVDNEGAGHHMPHFGGGVPSSWTYSSSSAQEIRKELDDTEGNQTKEVHVRPPKKAVVSSIVEINRALQKSMQTMSGRFAAEMASRKAQLSHLGKHLQHQLHHQDTRFTARKDTSLGKESTPNKMARKHEAIVAEIEGKAGPRRPFEFDGNARASRAMRRIAKKRMSHDMQRSAKVSKGLAVFNFHGDVKSPPAYKINTYDRGRRRFVL